MEQSPRSARGSGSRRTEGGCRPSHHRPRRRFQAYGLGVSKSGTTSLARVCLPRYRSAHEPEWREVMRFILEVADGRRSEEELRRWVVERDARLRLEMDSSHLNSWLVEHLVAAFPKAKFVLLIRDPYSWLTSIVSRHGFRRASKDPLRVEFFRVRFPPIPADPEQERALAGLGLPSLSSYLCYWGEHNRRMLAAVPPDPGCPSSTRYPSSVRSIPTE